MSPQLKRQITVVLAVLIVIAGWLFSGNKNNSTQSPNPPVVSQSQPETKSDQNGSTQPAPPKQNQPAVSGLPLGSGFDFYVVSLSWSPTWCAASPDADTAQQCTRHMGLVMHGFWPQNESGYPEDCPSSEPDRVPDSLARNYLDLIPAIGLIGHEWRKHGTCSGLSQKDYLATARAAREKITTPPELQTTSAPANISVEAIEQSLLKANPGLSKDAIAVTCKSKLLEEVRICMTKDLKFRACGEVERASCRLNTISIPRP